MKWAVLAVVSCAAACGGDPCFAPGEVDIDIVGTFVVDGASEEPACRPMGEFLALPEPLHATIVDDETWTFDDPSLSVVLYPEDCVFTLIQQSDGADPLLGSYQDQLSYVALTHPAPDVWKGSGALRRTYANDATCENRISGVTVTLTWQ